MLNVQSVLIPGIIAAISIPIPTLAAPAFKLSDSLGAREQPSILAQQPGSSAPETSATTAIDSFMQTFNRRRSRSPGLSRSGGFCPITPGLVGTDQIWSDRPLFLWQGAVEQIQLHKLGNPEAMWSQALEPERRSIVYNGDALQPGQIYQWDLLGQGNVNASFVFEVMAADQRAPIAAQLQNLETQLKASGAPPETITIQQAQYFAEQNLWSDALQLLYSIDRPSSETTKAIQQMEASLCEGQIQ